MIDEHFRQQNTTFNNRNLIFDNSNNNDLTIGRVFANGPRDWGSFPGRVIPKTQKWYLIPPCLKLSIIWYVSRVKWSNPGNGVAPSPTMWCSSYRKGNHPRLRLPTLLPNATCTIDHTTKWYMHKLESVLKNETHKILWSFWQTDHIIPT